MAYTASHTPPRLPSYDTSNRRHALNERPNGQLSPGLQPKPLKISSPVTSELPPIPSKPQRNAPTPSSRGKKKGFTDVIDKLDVSVFGGSVHHAGPFDAASTHRNRTGAARPPPIAAFNPAAFSTSSLVSSMDSLALPPSGKVSERAQAALTAMHDHHGPYSAGLAASTSSLTPLVPASRPRRNSDSSVSIAGPPTSRKPADKDRTYMEAFGYQGGEAWEDFGRSHYANAKARESVYDIHSKSKLPKDVRAQRVASVWDMEATLREGTPVAASKSPPVPALPIMPEMYRSDQLSPALPTSPGRSPRLDTSTNSQLDSSPTQGSPESKLKRSKSLMNRIKKGVMKSSE